jgi:flavin reductase (DIM6/NTAB) family NADH-FMN oxidoreductase RutF
MMIKNLLEIAMNAESELMRETMRFWATGVTIVTAAHEGVQHGMTVSAFTSLTLTPPQVLISLARNARTHGLVLRAKSFGVTILAADQQEISERFAGRVPDDNDRLAGLETFTLVTGAPLLAGGLSHLDCRVVTMLECGTSTLFIGEVVATQSLPQGDPLLYFNRDYRALK